MISGLAAFLGDCVLRSALYILVSLKSPKESELGLLTISIKFKPTGPGLCCSVVKTLAHAPKRLRFDAWMRVMEKIRHFGEPAI